MLPLNETEEPPATELPPDDIPVPPETEEEEGGGVGELWKKIQPFIDPSLRAVRHIARHIHIKDLSVRLESYSRDAAIVGIRTGRKWAALGNACAALDELFGNVEYGELQVVPCWTKEMKEGESASCKLRFRPIFLISGALIFLFGWLSGKLKSKRYNKNNQPEISEEQ